MGVCEVYADGGVGYVNPSPYFGTWSWRHVDVFGLVLRSDSGLVEVGDPLLEGASEVSNNTTEYLAILNALKALPDGWSGDVFSDSLNAITRWRGGGTAKGVPPMLWLERLDQRKRLGPLTFHLLSGHPTEKHFATGVGKRGYPVSRHQHACDKECCRLAEAYWAAHPGLRPVKQAVLPEEDDE